MLPTSNPRTYGAKPFCVAVIHGGPGAAGELAAVAERLSARRGVLEPLQRGRSVESQVEELKGQLIDNAVLPVTLIGFSWGAWLSLILAARHHDLVKKLILIGSGPFEEGYTGAIMRTRLSRLSPAERLEAVEISRTLAGMNDPYSSDRIESGKVEYKWAMRRMGELFSKTDSFSPQINSFSSDHLKDSTMVIECDAGIYQAVWSEAQRLRQEGRLLELLKNIRCPVAAIHGDWDPHPACGVREPLERALKDFRFILLQDCGHKPWIEKMAKERFYAILEELID